MTYDEWRRLLREERLPAAVVDLDAFDRNALLLARLAAGKRLRLATKSIRVPQLLARALSLKSAYQGFMCYSAEEALCLGNFGFDDLLIAYPTLRHRDLACLVELKRLNKHVSLVVDSAQGIEALAQAAAQGAGLLRIVIEVDVSARFPGDVHLGARRSPVRTPEDLMAFDEIIARRPGLQLIGLMAYESHIAAMMDNSPDGYLPRFALRRAKTWTARQVARKRRELAEAYQRLARSMELFNGGGTGSLSFAAHEPWLTELSAGSGLMGPRLNDFYSNIRPEPACFFALQACRSPKPGMVTCQGGGYIASGAGGRDRWPQPYLPSGSTLTALEGAGEVQTPVKLGPGENIALGDPVIFRHAKAGELAERFQEYILVSGGVISGRAKTYRGLGWCFF